jgi:hypothetical protein
MRWLQSVRVRVFLTAWVVYSVHFATNVVREHYPAFSIAQHLTFKVDEYQGFHADIFRHTDGHSYVGNNVAVSVIAAIPLMVFQPVLNALERYRLRQLAAGDLSAAQYRTDKPNRREFFQLVRERGLDLRFGAATVITSAFLMAPLTALMVVLMLHILLTQGVSERRAIWLAFLFAFGTPIFFRTAHLNHNMFLMYAFFPAFALLWQRGGETPPVTLTNRLLAGFLGGFTLAADYMGVITLGALYLYLLVSRHRSAGWRVAFRESLPFVAGSIPPILFLLYSQWAMYGNPFLPGQYWMPEVNYTERGWRGFAWPSPDLYWLNLFSWSYGMYTFGPLLLLGLLPARRYPETSWILPRPERRFVALAFLATLTFCAANQYSRMQFNSGFRYLVPIVPLVFLAAADHLARMPRRWLAVVSAVAVIHSWVLTVYREPVIRSWQLLMEEGPSLPWLRVLRQTMPPGGVLSSPLVPVGVLGLMLAAVVLIWRLGGRTSLLRVHEDSGARVPANARALL